MIEIKNLEGISFEQIYTAFKSAFSDYEISVDKTELKSMLKRRGFNPLYHSVHSMMTISWRSRLMVLVNTIMANLLHTIREQVQEKSSEGKDLPKEYLRTLCHS